MGVGHIFRRVRSLAGVEPVVFLYCLALFVMHLVQNQYIYFRFSEEKGFPYWSRVKSSGGGGCKAGNSSAGREAGNTTLSLKFLEIEVQSATASLLFYYVMSYTPMLLVLPFWGSYTDRVGRKVGFLVPLFCYTVECGILLLIMYFHLPVYLILVSGFLQGLTGNLSAFFMACSTYLADMVPGNKLSFRHAGIQCVAFVAGTIGQLTSGLWIKYLGFKVPIWFVIGCLVASILYTVFLITESRKPDPDAKKKGFFTMDSIKSFGLLFKDPHNGQRHNLLLILVFMAVNLLTMAGMGSSTLLFLLRTPLCFGPRLIGYYNAYKFFTYGVACTTAIALLKKCMGEMRIVQLAYVFAVAGDLWFGFSDRMWMVFLSPVLGLLRTTHQPILASTLSRIVGRNEQGTLFSVIGQLNAIGKFLGVSLFNNVYPLSLRVGFPGLVFVLASGIAFLTLLATCLLDVPDEILNSRKKAGQSEPIEENLGEKPMQLNNAVKPDSEVKPDLENGFTTRL